MNHGIVRFFCVLLILGRLALCKTQDQAIIHVQTRVPANVSVIPLTSELHSVYLNRGFREQLHGQVLYEVCANDNTIGLFVQATQLYRNGIPTAVSIPLGESGVVIHEVGKPETRLNWLRSSSVGGLPARQSQMEIDHSLEADHYHKQLEVKVVWDPGNTYLPPGTYKGYIKLVGMLLPPK